MASSQVEIVSSSPFGCVLRGHNRKERCRDQSNVRAVQAVFEKNFQDLVRDHIHGCISLSSSAQNSKNHIPRVASWVTNEQGDCNRKKEEPSAITQRHSPVLDRWVTRQAQEVTKHVHEADQPLISPPNSSTASLTTSTSKTKTPQSLPSTQSEDASVKHNVGASSLVQMWEARLNRSNSINSNHNHNQSQSTCYALSAHENNATPVEEPSTGDSFDEKGANNEDSIMDWETQSERTAPSEPPPSSCSYSRSFDGGESERVRIADIIKRLANADDDEHNNNVTDSQSREHKHGVTSEQSEQRCFSLVVNSPRLRGRQAFNDLLILMEHDKNKELDSILERQPVTKFSRRGRLQAMLRLRCLQRSLTIQDKCRPQSLGAHVNRVPQGQGSAFMHLREKFGSTTGAEHLITPQKDPAAPKCLHNHRVLNNSIHLEKNSSSKPQSEDTHGQKVSSTVPQSTGPVNHITVNKNEDLREQTKPVSDSIQKKCLESPKTAEATPSLEGQSEIEMAKKQGSNSPQGLLLDSHEIAKTSSLNFLSQKEIKQEEDNLQQHLSLDLQETTERTTLNSNTENEMAEEQDIGDQQHLCLDSPEIVENSTSYNDQDESEVSEELEQYSQTNYDWFSNISRPRSYWEGLRKAWYQEVINTNSKNEEIRQLLERGRVSSCLASDFRKRIDRLMISRVQMQAERADSQEEVDDEDRMVQVMSYLQRHLHPAGDQGEEEVEYEEEEEDDDDDDEDEGEEEDEDDDDDDERSLISRQYHEANNYFNQSSTSLQMPSPSNLTSSWSSQDDNETGINSDRGPSAFSPPLGPSTTPYYEDTRHESSSMISRPSLEMELIFNLRGHIEQLQQEMAELRKSILSCMDMQMKFQQYSFNREVHSVGGEGKNSADRAPWKRSCCICYEMQVDSLLYRCGHMCTCLKCAQELQLSSGKCPVCGAPILDVVPAK